MQSREWNCRCKIELVRWRRGVMFLGVARHKRTDICGGLFFLPRYAVRGFVIIRCRCSRRENCAAGARMRIGAMEKRPRIYVPSLTCPAYILVPTGTYLGWGVGDDSGG